MFNKAALMMVVTVVLGAAACGGGIAFDDLVDPAAREEDRTTCQSNVVAWSGGEGRPTKLGWSDDMELEDGIQIELFVKTKPQGHPILGFVVDGQPFAASEHNEEHHATVTFMPPNELVLIRVVPAAGCREDAVVVQVAWDNP